MSLWREIRAESPWAARATMIVCLLVTPVILSAVASAIWYFLNCTRFLNATDPLAEWASFAALMGFVSQTLLGVATLGLAFLISGVLTRRLDRQRQSEQNDRELIRLSEKLVDTEFYLKVMYPAWEVALKWMDPALPDGDMFRTQVVSAEFRMPMNYRRRKSELALAESNPRMHPHYQPYDIPHEGQPAAISELSESLAFATWVRFWRNLKFLIDHGLVEKAEALNLFREWYMWWAPFMTEFAAVVTELRKRVRDRYNYAVDDKVWEESSIAKLQKLHQDFGISPYCGHPDNSAFGKRVGEITDSIAVIVFSAIEADRNDHVG